MRGENEIKDKKGDCINFECLFNKNVDGGFMQVVVLTAMFNSYITLTGCL